ncbi:MAG: glycoside hydrolase family 15 protein [Spirochaetales bacterium]|nr:glycoside hydrolase family 15 protein [Spirochaetales bacterium]
MTREQLFKQSIKVIKDGQHPTGGYVACPTFPTYNYSWFRDSAYIAYAMDLASEHDSAARFHSWAVRNILAREKALEEYFSGGATDYKELLHTRYTLEGDEGTEEWENFQLDSFGIWLWSVKEHLSLSESKADGPLIQAVNLVARYLTALWQTPCYDCWEENEDKVHIYTLATIYRGLICASEISGTDYSKTVLAVKNRIEKSGCAEGHLVKYEGIRAVDSSLLGAGFPCFVFDPDHPVMDATIKQIEADLLESGGLHRYRADTYYGGGIWILLTAWLGINEVLRGNQDKAEHILDWILSKAGEDGHLPEQLSEAMNDPSYLSHWNEKWGFSANPLLWSHAMYIILYMKLGLIK